MRRIILFAFILSLILVAIPVFTPSPVSAMTGSGTEGDPYMVYDVDDLQAVGNGTYSASAYYELANDIDASATSTWNWDAGRGEYEGFVPIPTFTGHFDGNLFIISDLYINNDAPGLYGLFSELDGSAQVHDFILDSIDYSLFINDSLTASPGIGGVAGKISDNNVDIYRVLVLGTVYMQAHSTHPSIGVAAYAGGIVGVAFRGVVKQCGTAVNATCKGSGAVTNGDYAGGISGQCYYVYHYDCYARGPVYGDPAGGAIGNIENYCAQYRLYSTGDVSGGTTGGLIGDRSQTQGVYNSFWDLQTSGQATSDGGTGKNTTDMKIESTFTDAGWDFDTIWSIGGAAVASMTATLTLTGGTTPTYTPAISPR